MSGLILREKNGLLLANFMKNEIRCALKNDEIWFVAKDVCELLCLGNVSQAVSYLDADEKIITNDTRYGNWETILISESGLYELTLKSRTPEAVKFKKWITKEFIPAIRKHGMYATPQKLEEMLNDPDTMIQTLQTLKKEREAKIKAQWQLKIAEDQIIENQPKVDLAESFFVRDTLVKIGVLAQTISGPTTGVVVSQKALFSILRSSKIIYKDRTGQHLPYQKYIDEEWFRIKPYQIVGIDSDRYTVQATPKGCQEIIKLLNGKTIIKKKIADRKYEYSIV